MWIILVIVALLVLFVIGKYNSLVQLRNKVKDQFSQIDVQLKRRSDLIPNLVETVKGYAKHESETFEKVVNARNSYLNASTDEEKIKASNELSGTLSKLFALAENYPELKANTNFEQLQGELKETEDKIAYSRQFFNDVVLKYNNAVEVFPSNIIANMFGFKKETFFEATNEEKQNVEVKF